tara:strand:+ start:1208 stop:1951 length:744 start_codon:yes stop_codon:yes gene_type:complete
MISGLANMIGNSIVGGHPSPGGGFTNLYSTEYDGVDDYITTSLNLARTTYPNISLSCWVKMDKSTLNTFTSYNPMGVYVQVFPNSSPIRIYTDGLKNAYVRVQGNGTSNTTTDLADGSWHHIIQTCEYDAGGTIINVYIDGVKEITNALFLSYAPITGDLFIGSRNASTFFFNGLVDEVAVFISILSQSDVTSIYNGGVPNNLNNLSTPPLSWWRFEEGSGTTAADSGTGGNTGTLVNGTAFSTDVP